MITRNGRVAPRKRGEHVAQGGGLQRGHDADAARIGGQRLLVRGIEQPFPVQFVAQLEKGFEQRALAGAAHGFDVELEIAARLVQA